jgi:hypothetical protein
MSRKMLAAGAAALALIGGGAVSYAATGPQTSVALTGGQTADVTCPNQLTIVPNSSTDVELKCADGTVPPPSTTVPIPTTTTIPDTTTTSVPIPTTTTIPDTTTTTVPVTGGTCTNPSYTSSDAEATDNIDPSAGEYWWVNNDAWSGGHGPQTINVCNQSSWYAVSNQTDQAGAVETYPDTEYDIGGRANGTTKTIAQYSTINSTFSEAFPSAGSWDAAYDLWLNNFSTEIMIWNEYTGSNLYYEGQGTPVTLDGVPYHLINSGGGEYVFTRDTMVKSGSVDILAALQVLEADGYVQPTDVPTQFEYGVEISSTNGSETFPLTGLSYNLG